MKIAFFVLALSGVTALSAVAAPSEPAVRRTAVSAAQLPVVPHPKPKG